MKQKLCGRHGTIMLFLCFLLSAVIIMESIYIAGAYRRKREVILAEAVSHQVEQALSQFDRNYLDWYGVYALTSVDADRAVFDRMTKHLGNVDYCYELTDELKEDDLRAVISEYMRLRGIAFEGSVMMDRLNISISQITGNDKLSGVGVAAWLPTFKAYLENKEKYSPLITVVEKVCKATGISDKLSDFFDFIDDLSEVWAKNSSTTMQIGDSSAYVSVFDPTCLQSLTGAMDAYMDMDLPSVADRLLMNEYATFSFDSNVKSYDGDEEETNIIGIPFKEMHDKNRGDLEYLLVGESRPIVNTYVSFGLLLGTRLLLDMSAYLMDDTKKAIALGIAEVLSVLIAVLSGGSILVEPSTLQYVVLFIMAYIRAYRDGMTLLSGYSVPLFYNDNVTDTLGDFADTYYRDYFRIFLLFVPEETLLCRMRQVITMDCGQLYTGISATGSLGDAEYHVKRRYELYEAKN
ncbi:MAG: hypothetical protein IK020_01540 [Clostridiales bacterium]|nr:hypothetical protein [Clostridiales bacterium]